MISPSGRNRATFKESPARCITSTTTSTSLLGPGCSSASPSRLRLLAINPAAASSFEMLRPRAAFVAAVRLRQRPAPVGQDQRHGQKSRTLLSRSSEESASGYISCSWASPFRCAIFLGVRGKLTIRLNNHLQKAASFAGGLWGHRERQCQRASRLPSENHHQLGGASCDRIDGIAAPTAERSIRDALARMPLA